MGFLSPKVKIANSQGQTSEFAVTNSSYDEPIPELYGTNRMSGNVIWADEIREEKSSDVQREGGKGGPRTETTTTTFEYFVHLAVMFCEGEVSAVNRIWADGKLIYDVEGDNNIGGLNFRFYPGDDQQTPDPLIQEFVGENETPAFRGRCYIVFEDLPLSNFGNRIPAITAELANEPGSAALTVTRAPDELPNEATSITNVTADRETDVFYALNDSIIAQASAVTGASQTEIGSGFGNADLAGTMADGRLLLIPVTSSLGRDISTLNQFSGAEEKRVRTGSRIIDAIGLRSPFAPLEEELVFARRIADVSSVPGYDLIDFNASLDSPAAGVFDTLDAPGSEGVCPVTRGGFSNAWGAFTSTSTIQFVRAIGSSLSLADILVPSDFIPGGTTFDNVRSGSGTEQVASVIYSPFTDTLIVQTSVDGQPVIMSWSEDDGVVWTKQVPFITTPGLQAGQWVLDGGDSIVLHDGLQLLHRISLVSGISDPLFTGTETVPEMTSFGSFANPRLWYGPTQSFIYGNTNPAFGDTGYYLFNLAAQGGGRDLNPRQVIAEVCERVGLVEDEDFVVSELPTSIPGLKSLVVGDRQTAADSIGALLDLLQIDVVETDFRLRFFRRGSVGSIVTILEDDMVEVSDNENEAYVRAIIKERDLPRRFEVSYLDFDNSYQPNVQADDRADTTQFSQRIETLDYNGAATATLPREAAQIELYSLWNERARIRTRLSQQHLTLDPGDVITAQLNNGDEVIGRLRKSDTGDDFTIDIEQVAELSGQYIPNIEGTSGDGTIVTVPANTNDSDVFLLDTPLLRDVDSAGQEASITYWAASGEPKWNGAILYRVTGTSTIENRGKQIADVAYGNLETAPVDATSTDRFVDEQFDITITRGIEQFASASDIDVLNGANLLLIRKANGEIELVQFATSELVDENTIRVSRLLRGRRGTEHFANGFTIGDEVLLLSTVSTNIFSSPLEAVNSELTYRGVTIGQLYEAASNIEFTDTARDLKPYAPVRLAAEDDGASGLDISWVRRTRIGGELDLSQAGDVPLSEQSEAYEVDILNAAGDTVLRTLSSAAELVNYPAADITTDFGSLPATLNVVVYQISAAVGRGFPANETLETA